MTAITNLPDLRPSLLLDFANSGGVDPRIKFSRASTATYFGSDGVLRTAPAGVPRIDYDPVTGECRGLLVEEQRTNLLTYSEQFDNAAWVKTASSITAKAITAPDGALTADKLIADTSTGTHLIRQTFNFVSGTAYTFSTYAKARELRSVRLLVTSTAFTENKAAAFDLVTGTLQTSAGTFTHTIANVGNGWYRVSITATATATVSSVVEISLNNGTSSSFTGNGIDGIYIWGAQLEEGSFPTSYIPSSETFTGRASAGTYIGSDGLLKTAASGEARYQYNPLNLKLAPKLLLEEQRTNLLLRSSELGNATWVKFGCSVSANALVGLDGVLSADKLVENTNLESHYIVQTATVTPNANYTFTVYLKTSERSSVNVLIDGGNGNFCNAVADLTSAKIISGTAVGAFTRYSSSITDVGGGWFRLSLSSVVGNSSSSVQCQIRLLKVSESYTGDGTSGIYIWGAQLEEGAYPTSYIPTAGAQVTRVADSSTSAQTTRSGEAASMTGTSFSDWYRQDEGTFFVDALSLPAQPDADMVLTEVFNSSATNARRGLFLSVGSGNVVWRSANAAGTMTDVVRVSGATTNPVKLSAAWQDSGTFAGVSYNADAVISRSDVVVPLGIDSLHIGRGRSNNAYLNGHIRRIAYYPRRITNKQLQTLTTI